MVYLNIIYWILLILQRVPLNDIHTGMAAPSYEISNQLIKELINMKNKFI
jgi:hypothetical protein